MWSIRDNEVVVPLYQTMTSGRLRRRRYVVSVLDHIPTFLERRRSSHKIEPPVGGVGFSVRPKLRRDRLSSTDQSKLRPDRDGSRKFQSGMHWCGVAMNAGRLSNGQNQTFGRIRHARRCNKTQRESYTSPVHR
jgi:hypothetical protein